MIGDWPEEDEHGVCAGLAGRVGFRVLADDTNGDRVTGDVDLRLAWQYLRCAPATRGPALYLNDDGMVDGGDAERKDTILRTKET